MNSKILLTALVGVSFIAMGCVTAFPQCSSEYNACRQTCGQDTTGTCERACVNSYNYCVQTSTPQPTVTPTARPTPSSTLYPDGCDAWRACYRTAMTCMAPCPACGTCAFPRCDAQYLQCVGRYNPYGTPSPTATPTTGAVRCGWCGQQCRDMTPGLSCAEIAPPAGYDCVQSGNECVPLYNGRTSWCRDTDSGKDIWAKGTVTAPQGPWARPGFGATADPNAVSTYVDHCTASGAQGTVNDAVVEYYCQPNNEGGYEVKADVIPCPESTCTDGKCTPGPGTP